MLHAVFVVYLLSLMAGTLATGISILVYLRQRQTSLKYFIFFLVSLLLFLLSFITSQYSLIAGIGETMAAYILMKILAMAGALLFISIAPFWYHAVIGNSLGSRGQFITGILVAISIGLMAASIAMPDQNILIFVWIAQLLGMILYGLLYLGINIRNIGDSNVRKGIIVFLLVTMVYLPLQAVDFLLGHIPELQAFSAINNLVQPCYFLGISLLFVLFAVKYFSEPAYLRQGVLTDHFRNKFGISERECEIILRLLAGESAKDISGSLNISPKTVENHIYNIFKKCCVNSRLQLHQAVFSNASQ